MAVYYPPEDEAREHALQKNADMHAGNEREPKAVEQEVGDKIDWEAHRRFMQGL